MDRSGSVSLTEIQKEFADINVAMVLKDIKESGKEMGLDKMFKAVDSIESGKLNVVQFAELISLGSKSASKDEIDLLFRIVDK